MTFSPRVLFFALRTKVLLMKETLAITAQRKLSTNMQLIHFANSPERVGLFHLDSVRMHGEEKEEWTREKGHKQSMKS